MPAASHPVPGGQSETQAHQPGQDIVAALQSLARQVSELQADNDRLREDYDRLSAEVARIRALMRQVGGAIAGKPASCWPAPGTSAAATTTAVPGPACPGMRLTGGRLARTAGQCRPSEPAAGGLCIPAGRRRRKRLSLRAGLAAVVAAGLTRDWFLSHLTR